MESRYLECDRVKHMKTSVGDTIKTSIKFSPEQICRHQLMSRKCGPSVIPPPFSSFVISISLWGDSPWFFIFHHFSESQWLQDATNNQDAASDPRYEQSGAKCVSVKGDETWCRSSMWMIRRIWKQNNKLYVLRGHSSHSSTHSHPHPALHVSSVSFVSSPIVDDGGHPETGPNLIGIDRSSCNATHTWEKVMEIQKRSGLYAS